MNSPELLLLVENCPKGAETLVTRCLHILTDKGEKREKKKGTFFCLFRIEMNQCVKHLKIKCFLSTSTTVTRVGGESPRPVPQAGA